MVRNQEETGERRREAARGMVYLRVMVGSKIYASIIQI